MTVEPLTLEIHDAAVVLAEQHGFSTYDAMIDASSLAAGYGTLWSEDMHDGLVVAGTLTIRNPF